MVEPIPPISMDSIEMGEFEEIYLKKPDMNIKKIDNIKTTSLVSVDENLKKRKEKKKLIRFLKL